MSRIAGTAFEVPASLEGPTLALRPLAPGDEDTLAPVLQDPDLWAQHPAKDRGTEGGSVAYVRWLIDRGGAMLVTRRHTREVVGTSRYYRTDDLPEGALAIGYTVLARTLWGGDANREMKGLMLAPLFEVADACWLHIAPGNLRSQRATAKLGAVFVDEIETDGVPGTPGRSQRWRLDREAWAGG